MIIRELNKVIFIMFYSNIMFHKDKKIKQNVLLN